MIYKINIEKEEYEQLINKKYHIQTLIYNAQYQNIKYNDVIEYHCNNNILKYNIRKVVYSTPFNKCNEKNYGYICSDKYLKENEDEIRKYGIIYLFLYYKSEVKEEYYELSNQDILFNYLIKEKYYLKDCVDVTKTVYKQEEITHQKCKIELYEKAVNPHLLKEIGNIPSLMTFILNLPFNLVEKLMRYEVFIKLEENNYTFVSNEYFRNNASYKYIEGNACIEYLVSRLNIEEEINDELDQYRKELLINVKEFNLIDKYLFIDSIIVPDVIVKFDKNREKTRLDFLYYVISSKVLKAKKFFDSAPYIVVVNEKRMLVQYLNELIKNLLFNDLLDYNDFSKLNSIKEIKDLEFFEL